MTDRWHEYVSGGLSAEGDPLAAAYRSWTYLRPLLIRMRRALPQGGRVLELGCGAGLVSALFASWGHHVTAVDNDEDIVRTARETTRRLGQSIDVVLADALNPPGYLRGFDLVFSLGLVEHFDRDVTVEMLRRQRDMANTVVPVIPTRHTRHADGISDERIYSLREFRDLLRDASLETSQVFAFGDVPSLPARAMRNSLPPRLYQMLQSPTGLAMNFAAIAGTGK
ncbi:MAG: class I SAM-dependent methyltransferase [Actinomycetota bacterium]